MRRFAGNPVCGTKSQLGRFWTVFSQRGNFQGTVLGSPASGAMDPMPNAVNVNGPVPPVGGTGLMAPANAGLGIGPELVASGGRSHQPTARGS